ncbi:MAG: response regulator transcription factor [Dehalococcoidia bacterium]|nr:response regulator transcription factor [Dehalococcoidia bacterium]
MLADSYPHTIVQTTSPEVEGIIDPTVIAALLASVTMGESGVVQRLVSNMGSLTPKYSRIRSHIGIGVPIAFGGINMAQAHDTISIQGKELGDQLARCMAAEKVSVLMAKDVGKVRFGGEMRAVVLDASVVPLNPATFQSLREQAKVPVLAVVPTHEEARLALQLGCNEVLVRPFDLQELKLRGHKLLRRVGNDRLLVSELLIDLRAREVRRGEEKLHLTKIEFNLLAYLARNTGRVVGYDELLEKVWGYEADDGSYGLVRMCVSRLRRKIGDAPGGPQHIVCVRGVGYRLGKPE